MSGLDFSSVVGSVDFAGVVVGVLAVGVAKTAVLAVTAGTRMVLSMIGGDDGASSGAGRTDGLAEVAWEDLPREDADDRWGQADHDYWFGNEGAGHSSEDRA